MKTLAAVAAILFAFAIHADEPDYSRDALRQTFSAKVIELGPKPKPRVQFKLGAIEFRALGMDWRLIYLPIMLPLSGTRPGVTQELPDPFALTGAVLPGAPAHEITDETPREIKAELRRIKRVTR
jgi:hypothetical protein